jgi:hypothetical protein
MMKNTRPTVHHVTIKPKVKEHAAWNIENGTCTLIIMSIEDMNALLPLESDKKPQRLE